MKDFNNAQSRYQEYLVEYKDLIVRLNKDMNGRFVDEMEGIRNHYKILLSNLNTKYNLPTDYEPMRSEVA